MASQVDFGSPYLICGSLRDVITMRTDTVVRRDDRVPGVRMSYQDPYFLGVPRRGFPAEDCRRGLAS